MKFFLTFTVCAIFAICASFSGHALPEKVSIISYGGDAKVVFAGQTDSIACKPGMLLEAGARLITGKNSFIEIAFDENADNIVKVEEETEVIIKLSGIDKIELVDGEMFTLLQALDGKETFQVRTPFATCGARGTGWRTKTDGNTTDVAVIRDKVYIRGINKDGSDMEKKFWVKEGFERKVNKFERPGKTQKIDKVRFSGMEKEIKVLQKTKDKKRVLPKEPIRTLENPIVNKLDDTIDKMDRIDRIVGRQEKVEIRERIDDRREGFRDIKRDNVLDRKSDNKVVNIRLRKPKPDGGGNQ